MSEQQIRDEVSMVLKELFYQGMFAGDELVSGKARIERRAIGEAKQKILLLFDEVRDDRS